MVIQMVTNLPKIWLLHFSHNKTMSNLLKTASLFSIFYSKTKVKISFRILARSCCVHRWDISHGHSKFQNMRARFNKEVQAKVKM